MTRCWDESLAALTLPCGASSSRVTLAPRETSISRAQIFEQLYSFLSTDTALLTILGGVTPENPRLFRSFPQLQAFLKDYEPESEGWMLIDEPQPYPSAYNIQEETIYDVIEPVFNVVATRFSLIDDVIDHIDTFFHWSIDQQRDLSFAERLVLTTRRIFSADSYNKEIKLMQKDIRYRMVMVLEEQPA